MKPEKASFILAANTLESLLVQFHDFSENDNGNVLVLMMTRTRQKISYWMYRIIISGKIVLVGPRTGSCVILKEPKKMQ